MLRPTPTLSKEEQMRFVLRAAAAILAFAACEPASPNPPTAVASHAKAHRPFAASRAPSDPKLVAAIRAATARYHNIEAALADGYVDDGFGCVADPQLGGMGIHLINEALHAEPRTDPLRPDLLVYEPGVNGKPRLVALEYEVFQQDWFAAGNTAPPTLLGQEFEAIDFPPLPLLFGLHVWAFKDNPAGMFAAFNPRVRCP